MAVGLFRFGLQALQPQTKGLRNDDIEMTPNKYQLYELSVQSPAVHAEWLERTYKEIMKKKARRLREDFCGTFVTSCEWVKRDKKNTALCLDLDPEPLDYGRKNHLAKMTPDQQKRVKAVEKDVLNPTTPGVDMIIACNFSYYIFKERQTLLKYFKSCLKSLSKGGIIILELAGGPGMTTPMKEKKEVLFNKKKFVYIWDQVDFDPITHDAVYEIHFKLWNGKKLKHQFTYDWRIWSIPETRDLLVEAGFDKTLVYWETSHKGKGTGEYVQMENGDNSYAWVAYVMGIKK